MESRMQAQIQENGRPEASEDRAVLIRCLNEICAVFPLYFCHSFGAHPIFRVSRGLAISAVLLNCAPQLPGCKLPVVRSAAQLEHASGMCTSHPSKQSTLSFLSVACGPARARGFSALEGRVPRVLSRNRVDSTHIY